MPQLVHEHYKSEMEEKRLIKKDEEQKKKGEEEKQQLPPGCSKDAYRTGNQSVQIQWIKVNGREEDVLQKVEIRRGFHISVGYKTCLLYTSRCV